MRKVTERIVMSFTCFAMFFGAGNLIFPAFLSFNAGSNTAFAFIGFALSAITLPVLALIAVGRTGSLERLSARVNPFFARVFTIVIYLAIGPMLAIPRTASTSYEMVKIAFSIERDIISWLYSALFFALAGVVALKPEKLSKRLGKILSPILITLIIILFISVFFMAPFDAVAKAPYDETPFLSGVLEGYQTMDAIAGLVFGTVIAINLRKMGIEDEDDIRREGGIAAVGGGILLLVIYLLLSAIGMSSHVLLSSADNGADILSAAASFIFPAMGRVLIAAIFIIACFNTSVGLLSSVGEYFNSLYPSLSRAKWIFIFALISAIIANAGLDTIISISSPVLEVIYPVAITLMVLSLADGRNNLSLSYKVAIPVAFVFSLVGIIWGNSFIWIIPTLIAMALGVAADKKR